jgi:glycosyltransferase involved in cell wall biosynthesis
MNTQSMPTVPSVAVLVPCRNEAPTVGIVVADFLAALPGCTVYVYDNGSTDGTGAIASSAGALVRHEPRPGKGGVVRRMFAEIDADVYVIVDGDATYDASRAPALVELLVAGDLDMVTAVRQHSDDAAYTKGRWLGNRLFNALMGFLLGERPADMFSGYRVLSRRFVKSFPAVSQTFEIETEMTMHAFELRVPTAEVPTHYAPRPEGSESKLRTVRDGVRIFRFTLRLFKDVKPFVFFSLVALLFAIAGLALGAEVIVEFMRTGLVPRLPTAVLATGLMLVSALLFTCGLILDTVTRARVEMKRLAYLASRNSSPRSTVAGQTSTLARG